MKSYAAVVIAVVLASASVGVAERHLVEGIVVRVNDRILTTSDIRDRASERAAETGAPATPETYADLIQEATDELCMLERSIELKIEVPKDEVAAAVQQIREQNHVEDDAALDKTLHTMGLTLDSIKQRLRERMTVSYVLRREVGALPITEEELRQRYARDKEQYRVPERVHLEHLVLPLAADGSDRETKLAAARKIVAASRATGNFLTIVQGELTAGHGQGGDLGTVALPDLRTEVRGAVATLKANEIAEPFVSSAGVHIVRVLERFPPSYKSFESVIDELRDRELGDRYHTHLTQVVSELKKRYVVEVHHELMVAVR